MSWVISPRGRVESIFSRRFIQKHLVDRSSGRQPTHLARQPLEVYPWPQRRPEVFEWLEQAIQTAVQQLDKAPFLELVYPKRFTAECVVYSVQDSVVQLPQVTAM